MERRSFGKTDIKVTPLGFGAGHIGGFGMTESAAGYLLNQVLDFGINFIDTARGYGLSEERIGRHIGNRREDYVLCTKCGYGAQGFEDWTPGCITAGIEAALTRLRTDYIDIMLLHSCPKAVLERKGIIEALERAVDEGKVRFAGYSGENDDLIYGVETGKFNVIETSVNVFDQKSLRTVLPEAVERGIGVIAKRPLANAPWRHSSRPTGEYVDEYWQRMGKMHLDLKGYDWDDLALRFAAYAPGVSTAITGTGQVAHLRRNIEVIERGPLPVDMAAMIRDAFEQHGQDWPGEI
jgi:aryl-alcohol dehydrogenase-like predicted oxidoreductase